MIRARVSILHFSNIFMCVDGEAVYSTDDS